MQTLKYDEHLEDKYTNQGHCILHTLKMKKTEVA